MKSALTSIAEEFRIYAKAECLPESARWLEWADTLDAADGELHAAHAEIVRLRTAPNMTTNINNSIPAIHCRPAGD